MCYINFPRCDEQVGLTLPLLPGSDVSDELNKSVRIVFAGQESHHVHERLPKFDGYM